MSEYTLTVFESTGKLVFEDRFEAENDVAAKQMGEKLLEENNYSEYAHRLTRSGKLLLFHR
ncbi:hypothetical protein GN156_12055 [bacterium LRH843]|nr:hypothetical protein [bacterium LRH843]